MSAAVVGSANILSPDGQSAVLGYLFGVAELPVAPWVDPVVDTLGHDPRSAYVERFWLGVLGPSTTWLLRRIAAGFDRAPAGFNLPLAATARELGLGDRGGRHSPFLRALYRCCQFELARPAPNASGGADGTGGLEVRRKIPPLNRRQLARLPEPLQRAHAAWQATQLAAPEGVAQSPEARHRARQVARSLLSIGEEPAAVERALLGLRLPPTVARAAVVYAMERYQSGDEEESRPA